MTKYEYLVVRYEVAAFGIMDIRVFASYLPYFSSVVVLNRVYFLMLRTSRPSFGRSVIDPPTFAVRTLASLILF